MLYTTYNLAVKHNACERALKAWDKHVRGMEKFGVDTQIPLTDVLDVLGIDDCLWAFRTVQDEEAADTIAVKFLIAIADRMIIHLESKYPGDKRPCQAIEALRVYLSNPSREAAYAVDSAYSEARKAKLSIDDDYSLWALLAGGIWNSSSSCGSRYRYADYYRWNAYTTFGGRALAESEQKWQIAKLKELLNEV